MRLALLLLAALTLAAPEAWACRCEIIFGTGTISEGNIKAAKIILKGKVLSIGDLPPDENYDDLSAGFLPAHMHPHFREVEIEIDEIYKGEWPKKTITAYVQSVNECGLSFETITNLDFFILRESDSYTDYALELANECESKIDPKDKEEVINHTFSYPVPKQRK